MATDHMPQSSRDTTRPPAETRRFVPTLTEVLHLPATEPPQAPPPAAPVTLPIDPEVLVSRVCATVMQGLDDHVRAVVADAMQAQHMLLVQSLRKQLAPLVDPLVRDVVAGEMAAFVRQAGDSCIQATD